MRSRVRTTARSRRAGLEASQFTVLAALADAATFTMTQLADRLLMDRTTLTRNVRPLVHAGYVAMRTSGDQRRRFVELSGRGRLWRAVQRQAVGAIGRARFLQLVERLDAASSIALNIAAPLRKSD